MMKRICKFRYKLIMLLLILSILLGEFAVRPMSVKAIDLVTYTYWDLWYSISGAQHVSMSAKDGPFTGDDVSNLKSQWSTAWDNYNIWLDTKFPALKDSTLTVPRDVYLEAKAARNDRARVQFQDFLFYLKDTASDLVPQAYDLIQNAKTTGLEMSQELWDAFSQYFYRMDNGLSIKHNLTYDQYYDFIYEVSGRHFNPNRLPKYNCSTFVILQELGTDNIYFLFDTGNSVFEITSNSIKMYNLSACEYRNFWYALSPWEGYSRDLSFISQLSFDNGLKVLSVDGVVNEDISKEYSPFIDYTVSQGCPVEVPETIPWRVYPKEETDDDTKIIPFPVEVPDEGTTEVPGEETTEKPNPDEDPDNDNDEENDPFPGIFPWFPNVPSSNPDENPDIPPWENPDSDSDPDSGLSPDPDPDPDPAPDPPEPEPDPDPPGKVENYLNKLKTKFPFCIPFDMVALFKNLKKTQKAPKWTFSYTFHFGDKPYTWKIVVDMADYDKYIQIFREGFFVLFLVGLFFATRKLISWQID